MKLIQSLFLVCLILFANINLYVYQNWCHGENIGYTVNSKKFDSELKASTTKEKPLFKKDNCCKDVLIKYNENSVFSIEKAFQFSSLAITAILPNLNWNLNSPSFNQKTGIPQLYPNPPPVKDKLFQLYCRYTYYG